jgi:GntR family transcriptional regulator
MSKDELNTISLFDLLRNKYKINLIMSKEFFEPIVVDEYEAQILGVKRGAPAMMLEGIIYTENDQPVMLSRDIVRGDRCRYIIRSDNSLKI